MLEFGYAIFRFNQEGSDYLEMRDIIRQYNENITNYDAHTDGHHNCYLKYTTLEKEDGTNSYIISGNLRAWLEFQEYIYQNNIKACKTIYEQLESYTDGTVTVNGPDDKYVDPERSIYKDAMHPIELVTDVTSLHDEERMVHERFTVLFTVDRGVTHELVRMRECSFAQESTRYVNYSHGKYGNEITVIKPCFFKEGTDNYYTWQMSCKEAEKAYMKLTDEVGEKASPQEARTVLPNSLKAELAMCANLEEWRHIFELRACDTTGAAHPQMKEVMIPLCKEARTKWEFAFGDLVTTDERENAAADGE